MRILAIKTHAAGDLLLTTPAIRALRRAAPDAELVLLTGRANEGVAAAIPGVAATYFVDEGPLFKKNPLAAYRLLRNIRGIGADKAVAFQPSPHLARLVKMAGVPVFGPAPDARAMRHLAGGVPWRPNADVYIAENYVQVAEAAGGVRDDLRLDFFIPLAVPGARELTGLTGRRRYAVVAPGGGRNPRENVVAKLPPVELFAEIIDFIDEKTGRQAVLVGDADDEERCAAVAARCRRSLVNLAGRTTVLELGRLIEDAAYVITTDSLPMHIAVALGRPGLALFGPTNAKTLLPPGGPVVAVKADVPCAPCYANTPFPPCRRPFKYECRERIPTAPVKAFIIERENK